MAEDGASTDTADTALPVVAAWPRNTDGEFLVGGRPLSRVVAEVGGTPCYLYDRARIAARIAAVRSRLAANVHLHYAVKANPLPALVGFVAERVDGLDVASAGELRCALDTGMARQRISFAGPGKREAELRQAHAAGIVVNIESEREIDLLARLGEQTDVSTRVALRVNLPFELRASGMKMSGGAKPFGIDAERVPAALATIRSAGLDFEGFHCFAGSQNLRAEAIIEAQVRSYELVLGWQDRLPTPLRSLNLGGGFGIPYSERDPTLKVGAVFDALAELAARCRTDFGDEARLVLELGRYLVGEAGLYVVGVLDRKTSHDQVFLVTDGGMHQHLAASGNLGQVIRRNYPIAVNGGDAVREITSVVGPLCTPLDLLGDRVELAPAEPGDLIVVFQSGAYGASASPGRFLGHPPVIEALVSEK